MDSDEGRIKAIIAAHLKLAKAYEKMMRDIENKEELISLLTISLFKEKAAELDILDRRGIAYHVIDRISTYWTRTLSMRGQPAPLIFKPLVKYFLSAHIRRQYQKLYSLYLAELLLQIRSSRKKEDVIELKKIASDIKDYSETLPTLKGLAALLATTATLVGIFNHFVPIQTILPTIIPRENPAIGFISIVLLIILLYVVVFGLVPFIRAFGFKRFLFKDKQSLELHPFFFEEKKATKLYNSSVYGIEDKLFESLGGNREKPKEIPIDVILSISSYALSIAISFIFGALGPFSLMASEPTNILYVIIYFIAVPAVFSFGIVANISYYKNRVKARLV
jgi:hypothetical protein